MLEKCDFLKVATKEANGKNASSVITAENCVEHYKKNIQNKNGINKRTP